MKNNPNLQELQGVPEGLLFSMNSCSSTWPHTSRGATVLITSATWTLVAWRHLPNRWIMRYSRMFMRSPMKAGATMGKEAQGKNRGITPARHGVGHGVGMKLFCSYYITLAPCCRRWRWHGRWRRCRCRHWRRCRSWCWCIIHLNGTCNY